MQHSKVFAAPLRHDDSAPTVEKERGVVANASTNLKHALVSEIEVERGEVLLPALIVLDVVPAPTNQNLRTLRPNAKLNGQ